MFQDIQHFQSLFHTAGTHDGVGAFAAMMGGGKKKKKGKAFDEKKCYPHNNWLKISPSFRSATRRRLLYFHGSSSRLLFSYSTGAAHGPANKALAT